MLSSINVYSFWQRARFLLEYVVVASFVFIVGLLPARTASNVGGWLGRTIGMRIKRTEIARQQMATHLPDTTPEQRETYLLEMWDHLGRVFCEYPHLASGALDNWVEIHGQEHLEAAKAQGKPIMCISGHIGSWEMAPKAMALAGLKLHLVYRPPNNPYIDAMIHRIRSCYTHGHYGKGTDGAKGTLAAIKAGESVGMLFDQKDNMGEPIPFLEADAMTMVSGAKLALKSGVVMLPMRALRVNGTHFRMDIFPALEIPKRENSASTDAQEIVLTTQINAMLSDWVRENPGQWFWLHRRWPKT